LGSSLIPPVESGIKKPPGSGGFFESSVRSFRYAQISLPPVALENQK
jgi:hypothetical protein